MPHGLSRRGFLHSASLGIAATVAGPAALAAVDAEAADSASATPQRAMKLLVAGNRRWVTGQVQHPHQSIERRDALSRTQRPFATIVSCMDSRVPPELVFDRGLGDLAVIRTGAQVLDGGVVLGSIEFGSGQLHTPLIFVLGHQRCGAVVAAIRTIESGGKAPDHIQAVVEALRPAYHAAKRQPGDLVDNMIRAHIELTVERLKSDPPIERSIAHGELAIAGGYYSLDSGAVSIIA